MLRSRRKPGLLGLLVPALPIWLGLAGAGTVAAVEPAVDQELAALYAAQTLRVSVWLDKDAETVYRKGEPLRVTFQSNEDAYAVLYHIDVDGRVDILWPTSRYSDGFVFGGHQYRLPTSDAKRLRVGNDEGVGYVQAVVSRYPFDLRDLPLDFHHETGASTYDVYVAGDPYLAMNEINYTVTGLEDAAEYVITNHASYYVHRQVDHPRYLCSQCHDDDARVHPYRDTCTVTIQYDYGWQNQWWTTYRYYPVYYYPTYYYVDPWTGFRWVNYWYDPWYRWPRAYAYTWPHYCYDWRYSPYWTWDSYAAYQSGYRRYTPLSKPSAARDRSVVATRTKSALVTDARPSEDRLRAMKERTVARTAEGRAGDPRARREGPAGGVTSDVRRSTRVQERFQADSRTGAAPGLRLQAPAAEVRDARQRSQTGRPDVDDPGRDGRVRTPQLDTRRPGTAPPDDSRQQVRPPVEPRSDSGRVWTNRRSAGQTADPRPSAPAVRPPQRDAERRPEPPAARRPDAGRPRDQGTAGSRDSSIQRQQQQPSKPAPPPSPPPSPPSRSRDDRGSSVREQSQPSPPPAPQQPPPSRSGGSRGGRGDGRGVHSGPESEGGR